MLAPFFIGAGVLALLAFSSGPAKAQTETPKSTNKTNEHPDSEESKKAKAAAKSKVVEELKKPKVDFQKAVAAALESRDEKAVKAVVAQLEKFGRSDEARTVLESFKKLIASDDEKRKTTPAPKPKQDVKVTVGPAVITEEVKPAVEAKPTATKKPVVKKPATTKKPAPKPEDKRLTIAKRMVSMLQSSQRYKEDQALVKEYQAAAGETADGKYGPATARSLFTKFNLTPPNPYYWPKASKANTAAAVNSYSKFLDSIVQKHPSRKATVDALKRTVGK